MDEAPALTAKQRQSRMTQERLLAAGFDEFQEHGLAGARVDRIADKAGANKRLIYVYFGDKERLFDKVVVHNVAAMLDTVPFDADDLLGYAERLLDYLEDRPELTRLFSWRNLERTDVSEAELISYRNKVTQITQAQDAGRLDAAMPAVHVLNYVLGLVGAWTIASPALHQVAGQDGTRDLRRRSLREAVRRLLTAPSP
ncbi:TetR family transcriptional regulator [Streptosporangium sp. CA-115845]|uniref:TetR family transcriptional regulator n=1 Tax=Streptosporangium sp. CA-115845 TaxID=3240071 RepID=UPI003D90DBC3